MLSITKLSPGLSQTLTQMAFNLRRSPAATFKEKSEEEKVTDLKNALKKEFQISKRLLAPYPTSDELQKIYKRMHKLKELLAENKIPSYLLSYCNRLTSQLLACAADSSSTNLSLFQKSDYGNWLALSFYLGCQHLPKLLMETDWEKLHSDKWFNECVLSGNTAMTKYYLDNPHEIKSNITIEGACVFFLTCAGITSVFAWFAHVNSVPHWVGCGGLIDEDEGCIRSLYTPSAGEIRFFSQIRNAIIPFFGLCLPTWFALRIANIRKIYTLEISYDTLTHAKMSGNYKLFNYLINRLFQNEKTLTNYCLEKSNVMYLIVNHPVIANKILEYFLNNPLRFERCAKDNDLLEIITKCYPNVPELQHRDLNDVVKALLNRARIAKLAEILTKTFQSKQRFMPIEMMTEIAKQGNNPRYHSEKNAKKIAHDHLSQFNKPPLPERLPKMTNSFFAPKTPSIVSYAKTAMSFIRKMF